MSQEEEVLGKAYDSRLMARLLKYLRPYRWQVAIALVSILLKSFADVLGPYLTKVAIDRYLAPAKGTTSGLWSWLNPRPLTGIAQIAAMYIGVLLFSFLLEFTQTYVMQWTGQKVMFDLRSQIFRHLQGLHIAFFDRNPVGRLVTRVTSDVDALNEMCSRCRWRKIWLRRSNITIWPVHCMKYVCRYSRRKLRVIKPT